MLNQIRVVLADDHTLFRSGLVALLQSYPEIEVVAEVGDGQQALSAVANHDPDILVADLSMPRLDGWQVLDQVARRSLSARVLILSMHAESSTIQRAFHYGANGYLLKEESFHEFRNAIQTIAKQQRFVSPAARERLTSASGQESSQASSSDLRLTRRQREVLRLLALGNSTKAIARCLEVSPKTVETHRAQIMQRLEIDDVPSLVRYAIRSGLITMDD